METNNSNEIEKLLVKNYIRQAKRGILELARCNRIRQKDVVGAIILNNRLNEKFYTAEYFDNDTIEILGIENCCNYFKACCEQLDTYKQGYEYLSFGKDVPFSIYFDEYHYDPRKIKIELIDTSKIISDYAEIEGISLIETLNPINRHLREYINENELKNSEELNTTLDEGIEVLTKIPNITDKPKKKSLKNN